MYIPAMQKKVAPNKGVDPGHFYAHSFGNGNGLRPSPIKCRHSIMCSTIKVAPSTAVATIHLRARDRWPREDAETAMTIVKLDDKSTSVIMDENTMLG